MSRLDELIGKLCPDGVEYKPLKDILTIKNGSDYKGFPEGDIPVYGSGGIIAYTSKSVFDKPSVLIPRKGSIDKLYYVDTPFWNVDTIFYTNINTDVAIPRYVYHCLMKEHLEKLNTAGGVPSLTQAVLNKVIMPVPPLEVQREIVRILDNFTKLTFELTSELTARKQQYEYYRDKLLHYDNKLENKNSIRWMPLKNVCTRSSSGATPQKGNSDYYAGGNIPWLRTQDVKFNEIYEVNTHITELAVKQTAVKWIPENCVIVAISGASAGRCAINKIPLTTNQHCLNMEIDSNIALYKYVFYCICNQYDELKSRKEGARGDLNSTRILSMEIPVPSLDEQRRIVTILDQFDSLSNDISSGLPAEIEARQKQYEYYRDRLLTFKGKVA